MDTYIEAVRILSVWLNITLVDNPLLSEIYKDRKEKKHMGWFRVA